MKVEQISVFLENKSGRLAEVTETLAKSGINIRALSLADTAVVVELFPPPPGRRPSPGG